MVYGRMNLQLHAGRESSPMWLSFLEVIDCFQQCWRKAKHRKWSQFFCQVLRTKSSTFVVFKNCFGVWQPIARYVSFLLHLNFCAD